MKLKRPSPAMTVAVVALVMSMTGGAIAAVNFAKNAGAVDGKSAVRASASASRAAGNLVATHQGGDNKGKLPFGKLAGVASKGSVQSLSDVVARGKNGAGTIAVADNQTTAAETLIDLGLGALQVSCSDQNGNAGIENASTDVSITNSSGAPVNVARELGNGAPTLTTLGPGVVDGFTVGQQNTFHVQLQGTENRTVLVEGTAQQAGQGTADSSCIVWATAILVD